MDAVLGHVGRQLRALRTARRISLADLAQDVGYSEGYLSQVENGATVPALSALAAIAASLGTDMTAFFPPEDYPRVHVSRAGDPHKVRIAPNAREEYTLLTPRDPQATFTALVHRLYPTDETVQYRHVGERFALILDGEVSFTHRRRAVRPRRRRHDPLLLPRRARAARDLERTRRDPMVREPGDHLADPGSLLLRMGSRLRARRLGARAAPSPRSPARADVSVSYLSAVEKGTNQPSLQVLVRIVHALDLRDRRRAARRGPEPRAPRHGRPTTRRAAVTISHAGPAARDRRADGARPATSGSCPVDARRAATSRSSSTAVRSSSRSTARTTSCTPRTRWTPVCPAPSPGACSATSRTTAIWASGRALTAGI